MNSFKFALFACWFLVCGSGMAAEQFQLLDNAGDAQLQKELETLISQQNLTTAVRTKELAVVLAIVTDPDKPHLAELNGRNMLYAASLPKIAILLGAAVEIDEGRLVLDDELQTDLDNMIRYSCNSCATNVLARVGREDLLDILQSPEYKFYDEKGNGGLWVGKDYAPGTAYHRDPLANLVTWRNGIPDGTFLLQVAKWLTGQPETDTNDAGGALQSGLVAQICKRS